MLAEVLVGWEPSRVEQEYRRLADRYPAGPVPGSAGSVRRLRVRVAVFLGADKLPVRLGRDQVVLAVPPGQPPGTPVLLMVAAGVVAVAVGGRRFAVHGPDGGVRAEPVEAWPVLLADDQVIHTSDDPRAWPLLLVPPADTVEIVLFDTDQAERRVPLTPQSRGRPGDTEPGLTWGLGLGGNGVRH